MTGSGAMERGAALVEQFFVVPLQNALSTLFSAIPSILGALLILLLGGVIAKILEQLIVQGLKLIALDRIADQVQFSALLARGGIRRKTSELIGAVFYWIVMLAVIMTALDALKLIVAAQLLQEVVAFLPNVVAAVFILIVGIFVAAFLATTVRTAASNLGIFQAQLLGQAVQTIAVILTVVAALQQLNIKFVPEMFLILIGGASLGLALAFGLGCKDLAGRWVADLITQLNTKKR